MQIAYPWLWLTRRPQRILLRGHSWAMIRPIPLLIFWNVVKGLYSIRVPKSKNKPKCSQNSAVYRNRQCCWLFSSEIFHDCKRRQPTAIRQSYRCIEQEQKTKHFLCWTWNEFVHLNLRCYYFQSFLAFDEFCFKIFSLDLNGV